MKFSQYLFNSISPFSKKNVYGSEFMHSPLLELAYKLSKELTDIFNENLQKSRARRKIHSWIHRVKKSELGCFKTFLSTLDARMEEILNYFIHRQTSGFV